MATNKATPSRCRPIGQQPGRAVAGGVCFSQPCTCRAAHSHLACCLPKDLHSRRKGRGGVRVAHPGGGPLLPGFQLLCISGGLPCP